MRVKLKANMKEIRRTGYALPGPYIKINNGKCLKYHTFVLLILIYHTFSTTSYSDTILFKGIVFE